MTVFAYLISDDLQDIYFYIKKKKELWAMGAEQPVGPFQNWSWRIMRLLGRRFAGRKRKLEELGQQAETSPFTVSRTFQSYPSAKPPCRMAFKNAEAKLPLF